MCPTRAACSTECPSRMCSCGTCSSGRTRGRGPARRPSGCIARCWAAAWSRTTSRTRPCSRRAPRSWTCAPGGRCTTAWRVRGGRPTCSCERGWSTCTPSAGAWMRLGRCSMGPL
uniref:Uncharacterized protein n=1 Tax=Arundo donax TaxID=35708 RepID=A0A0A9HEL1_ARUDO